MKKFIIQSLAILIVIFSSLAYITGKVPNLNLINNPKNSAVIINDQKIKVEIADSNDKRKKGLGGRVNLASDSGMLFIFPKPDFYNFWMKGMKFPIDFIWINSGIIVDITKNAFPPNAGEADDQLKIYTSSQPVTSVLEVNAGFVDSHNIKIGDKIEIK